LFVLVDPPLADEHLEAAQVVDGVHSVRDPATDPGVAAIAAAAGRGATCHAGVLPGRRRPPQTGLQRSPTGIGASGGYHIHLARRYRNSGVESIVEKVFVLPFHKKGVTKGTLCSSVHHENLTFAITLQFFNISSSNFKVLMAYDNTDMPNSLG